MAGRHTHGAGGERGIEAAFVGREQYAGQRTVGAETVIAELS